MANFLLFLLILNSQSQHFKLAEKYLAKREYTKALAQYQNVLADNPNNFFALKGIASVYHKKREYDSALVWWQKVLALNPQDDTAIIKYWEAKYQSAKNNSDRLAKVKKEILTKAKTFLKNRNPKDWTIAYEGLALVDTSEAQKVGETLCQTFPESDKGYELIGNNFYDSLYPIWTDDTLKVQFLERFLKRYPKTEWRFTAYQYLLSSLFYLKDYQQLQAQANNLLIEDSLNPFAYQLVSALYLRTGIDTINALQYARRAIELEPKYQKPKNKPIEQWELEKPPLFGNARMNYAQALLSLGRIKEAKRWIIEAIKKTKLDNN
ncbi:MAG: hypothetical protein ABIK67_04015, partial [candidate division WOR-3 bacterium]